MSRPPIAAPRTPGAHSPHKPCAVPPGGEPSNPLRTVCTTVVAESRPRWCKPRGYAVCAQPTGPHSPALSPPPASNYIHTATPPWPEHVPDRFSLKHHEPSRHCAVARGFPYVCVRRDLHQGCARAEMTAVMQNSRGGPKVPAAHRRVGLLWRPRASTCTNRAACEERDRRWESRRPRVAGHRPGCRRRRCASCMSSSSPDRSTRRIWTPRQCVVSWPRAGGAVWRPASTPTSVARGPPWRLPWIACANLIPWHPPFPSSAACWLTTPRTPASS